MKRKILLGLVFLMLFSSVTVFAHPVDISYSNRRVATSTGSKNVQVVTANMNSKDLDLKVVTANNAVKGSEGLKSIVARSKASAAINGNYFDAYSSLEPYGTIMSNGEVLHMSGSTGSFVQTKDGKMDIGQYSFLMNGEILDDKGENIVSGFTLWYVNSQPTDPTGAYLYTPKRGGQMNFNGGTAIEVRNNKVTRILKNPKATTIPADGFLIYYGADAASDAFISRFVPGRMIDLSMSASKLGETEEKELDLVEKEYKDVLSAGPIVLENGEVASKEKLQSIVESKIANARAQRSALGITKDNKLILVTGSNLNMRELGEVLKNLGCVSGMNLDGGASSALYCKGKYLKNPGRNLNSVLTIVDKSLIK